MPKSLQSLGNAFGVIKSIDAEHQNVVRKLSTNGSGPCRHFRTRRSPCEIFKIDADRKCPHHAGVSSKIYPGMRIYLLDDDVRKQMVQAAKKVVAISVGLKSHHVKFQKTLQYRIAPRQLLKNIGRRKWDMQKEPSLRLLPELP